MPWLLHGILDSSGESVTSARGYWRPPRASPGAGGSGVTNPIVQELYDDVPIDKQSISHAKCVEGECLSKIANDNNVKTKEELKKVLEGSESEVHHKKGVLKHSIWRKREVRRRQTDRESLRFANLEILKNLIISKKNLDVLGLFSKLRACAVSVAGSS